MLQIKETTALLTEKLGSWLALAIKMLPNIALAIVLAILFYFLAKLGRYTMRKFTRKSTGNALILRLLGNLIFISILVIGLFAVLSAVQLDKTVTSLLAGAGIIGLALGLAFQETAANFLSGIVIAIRKPINLNDMVETNDEIGIVQSLNLRSTVLRNFQGQDVIVPNKSVVFNKIINYSRSHMRRLDLQGRVSLTADLEKVKKVALDSLIDIPHLDSNQKKYFWYEKFGKSSIHFTVAIWMDRVNQPEFRTFRSDAIMAIKKAFDENNIVIPFPIRTLDFDKTGGNGPNQSGDISHREDDEPKV